MDPYRILTRLRRNGQEHPVGEVILLPPDEATPLVLVGVLQPLEEQPTTRTAGRRGRRKVTP